MEPEQLTLSLGNKPHEKLNEAFHTGVARSINTLRIMSANRGNLPVIDDAIRELEKLLQTLYV